MQRENGDVGFGTSDPWQKLHAVDGNTPTLRLEQDGSSSFAPIIWDVAGNEENFFVRANDPGNYRRMPFIIQAGVADSMLVLNRDDQIGIGTRSPAARLHVANALAGAVDDFAVSTSGNVGIGVTNPQQAVHIQTSSQDTDRIRFEDGDRWELGSGAGDTLVIDDGHGDPVEVTIDQSGTMTLAGSLVTGGGGACDPGPCTARSPTMRWSRSRSTPPTCGVTATCGGVGPTPGRRAIDLTRKTTGILHELEKAHIYIEQLNDR